MVTYIPNRHRDSVRRTRVGRMWFRFASGAERDSAECSHVAFRRYHYCSTYACWHVRLRGSPRDLLRRTRLLYERTWGVAKNKSR